MNKNIVTIGGGTGTFVVLSALKNFDFNLSAIVSMCDDGGSTGKLRDDYGVLPPGDIRRSLVALSSATKSLRRLFDFRFKGGELDGHSLGNLFLTALEKTEGTFHKAVATASEVLNVKGRVIPVTLNNVRLQAELENGKVISGETNIDIPKHNPELKIAKVFLRPEARANPEALEAIKKADLVVVGPGDLYTSIVPNFLVGNIAKAVRFSKARKIFVCNLMTKNGETNNFSVVDFVSVLERHLGRDVLNYVLVNSKRPGSIRLKRYAEEKAQLVTLSRDYKNQLNKTEVLKANLLTKSGLIRHDPKKLASQILNLL
ncbi:MAG: YvcK family protein [Candidatus Yanofskybacteria bacterium]|nr:YvcK family protein [Candidatus Yanofskybacteria bacterium]